jgi:hypothetical protein
MPRSVLYLAALLALLPALALAFGQASLKNCSGTGNYVANGAAVTFTASCTNSGGQATGSWSRTSTRLTNTDSGNVAFMVSGNFTHNCPPSTASSGVGSYQQGPVASWRVWWTNAPGGAKFVPGIGGIAAYGTSAMNIPGNGQVYRDFPAGAQFELRGRIDTGYAGCQASFANAMLTVDQPAK